MIGTSRQKKSLNLNRKSVAIVNIQIHILIKGRKMSEKTIEITVIVASYNPKWEKLKSTILSVLLQKNVYIELVVADDGSKIDYHENVNKLVSANGLNDYIFLPSENNHGTVKNIIRAVEMARGKYIRIISPGDYLYSENSLCDWYSYMERNEYLVSFGGGVYYNDDEGHCKIIESYSAPRNLILYKGKRNENAIRKNYLQLDDMALGAAFLSEKSILLKYLTLICDKVRLGEDFLYKLMVFDGIQLHYYDFPVIWYEVGHGISSSSKGHYNAQMMSDWINTNRVMISMEAKDRYAKKLQRYFKFNESIKNKYLWKIYKCITSIDILFWKVCKVLSKSRTFTNPDMEFFIRINM